MLAIVFQPRAEWRVMKCMYCESRICDYLCRYIQQEIPCEPFLTKFPHMSIWMDQGPTAEPTWSPCWDIRYALPVALWTIPTGPFVQISIVCNVQCMSIWHLIIFNRIWFSNVRKLLKGAEIYSRDSASRQGVGCRLVVHIPRVLDSQYSSYLAEMHVSWSCQLLDACLCGLNAWASLFFNF